MKKEYILYLSLIFILIFFQPMTAYADMGPKPCIYITFENLDARTVYASLFALEGGPSPVSYGDWGKVPEEVKQRFLEYAETEKARFVEDVWIVNEGKPTMECGYMPPYEYKLVVYIPGEDIMLESDFYTRDRFEEKYIVNISGTSGKLILEQVPYDWANKVLPVMMRIALTIIIELVIAFIFKIRGKKSVGVIVATNVATQLFLNISLLFAIYQVGGGFLVIFLYLIIEILIFLIEASVYAIMLKKVNKPPIGTLKAISYALVANLVTFFTGFFIG